MTVAIHPSEARPQVTPAPLSSRVRKPLLAGVGLLALAAFAAGSFSFFSSLADPRSKPRPAVAAASWPELKDGVPALAESGSAPAAVLNLPRQASAAEPEQTPNPTAVRAAEPAPPTEPVRTEASLPQPTPPETAPVRETRRTPPIENAATLAGPAKPVALVAPRPAAPIAPARAETVTAKPAQPGRFVSLAPDAGKDAGKLEGATAKPKPAAPKAEAPAKSKVQARTPANPPKAPAAKLVAEAQPAPVPAAAAPEEPELMGVKIPGGRQLREGIQAMGSLFGGKSDGE